MWAYFTLKSNLKLLSSASEEERIKPEKILIKYLKGQKQGSAKHFYQRRVPLQSRVCSVTRL